MTGFFRKLIADQKGNTLAIFAAALVPLTIVIGSGLDLSIAYMAKAKLQNACDAAVLAGRQSMNGTTWSDAVEEEANRFFDFNFPELGAVRAGELGLGRAGGEELMRHKLCHSTTGSRIRIVITRLGEL